LKHWGKGHKKQNFKEIRFFIWLLAIIWGEECIDGGRKQIQIWCIRGARGKNQSLDLRKDVLLLEEVK
jgi:hypothetical protein